MSAKRRITSSIVRYDDPRSLGAQLRRRRFALFVAMAARVSRIRGSVSIVDVGGTREFWLATAEPALRGINYSVTILNMAPAITHPADHRIQYLRADACDMAMFRDREFDLAHSNSVLEHVGDWSRMRAFAGEIRRVATGYFVQTPNFWFPLEPHCMTPFFHWLPVPWRLTLVRRFALGNWRRASDVHEAMSFIEGARLLNRTMFQSLFPDAEIRVERLALLPKSLIALRQQC